LITLHSPAHCRSVRIPIQSGFPSCRVWRCTLSVRKRSTL
jgi:hypothetical protein